MVRHRAVRRTAWFVGLVGVAAALRFIEVEDRAAGTFTVRPAVRCELRAPVAGFLTEVAYDEGHEVSAGAVIGRLSIPELPSRLLQKKAELAEVTARLKLLEAGTRPEELKAQRLRVDRARAWCDLAARDLGFKKQSLEQELKRLDHLVAQRQAERVYAQDVLTRATGLYRKGSISEEQHQSALKQHQIAAAAYEQAIAERDSRRLLGVLEAEAELAARQKDLAEQESVLSVMESGARPEEIAAAAAQVARVQEELQFLESLQQRLPLVAEVSGVIVTPHLKEKIGHYFHEGELICELEDLSNLCAEVLLPEQETRHVQAGQRAVLKARSLPYETIEADVERLAPRAAAGELQSTLTAYCHVNATDGRLRPGMSGYARIYCGRQSLGAYLAGRLLRHLRTEFWW